MDTSYAQVQDINDDFVDVPNDCDNDLLYAEENRRGEMTLLSKE